MSVHLIVGSDEYLVVETAKKAIGDTTGLEVIDSLESTNAELQLRDLALVEQSVMTPPFLDPRKTTWWKNITFLPGAPGKKQASDEVKTALEAFAKKLTKLSLPENQKLVITANGVLKTSVFVKTLSTVAEVALLASEKSGQQAAFNATVRAIDLARELKLDFAAGVAERFIARVGTDTRTILSELTKLRDYLGGDGGTIDAAAVGAVTSRGIGTEPEVWEVTDAVAARQLDRALSAMRDFERESGFAVFMSGMIEKQFRQLYDLKSAQAAGHIENAARGMNSYVFSKLSGHLAKWTLPELRAARARFVRLRELAVSGADGVGTLVVTELVRVMRRRG